MQASHHPLLVVLSVAIAILASYAALDLATRVTASSGRARAGWLIGGSSAMGIGIWSMHFIAMLAFRLPVPILYSPPEVLLSVVAAIAASALALKLVARPTLRPAVLTSGAVAMGGAIAAMHYVGMAAMRMSATISYAPALVALSIAIAIGASGTALWLAFRFRADDSPGGHRRRGAAAVAMGLAIAGMHYSGMAAAHFTSGGAPVDDRGQILGTSQLAIAVGVASAALLTLALAGSILDRELRLRWRLRQAQSENKQALRSRALWNALSGPVLVLNAQGMMTYANHAACGLLGLPSGLTSGQVEVAHTLTFVDENGAPMSVETLPSGVARRTRQPVRGQLVGTQGTDHRFLWLLADAVPEIDIETDLVGDIVLSITDVTHVRQAQNALRESEERFRTMVDSLADGVVLQMADFSIEVCNASAVRITGLTADQMIGREPRPDGWTAIKEDGTRFDLMEHPSIAALLTGRPASRTLGTVEQSGDTRWMSVNTRPLFRNGEPKPYAALSSIIDLTDRVRAQEAERRAREEAEAASRAKSEFLANMSHEIRTPMNGVLGMLELALDTELTRAQREYVEVALGSAEALLEVINQILDFSKVEAGRLELYEEPFSLDACLVTALDPLALRAHRKGLEVAVRVAPGITDALVGDAMRLRQVLTNLVGNAIKFTARGEVVVTVEREPSADGERLHFAVRDTGIGVAVEKQHLVFEAFTQADGSITREFGGTGLGLSICARLVELMGGRIWLESEPGQGSTFHFTARFSLGSPESNAPLAVPFDVTGVRVLVVDDNATNRFILQEMLASWGMQCRLVESARDALDVLHEAHRSGSPFRLLLVDGHMPEIDGFTFIECVRKTTELAGATVLMLTSAEREGAATRCKELGVASYLLKPIRGTELRSAIAVALGAPVIPGVGRAVFSRLGSGQRQPPLRVLLAEDNAVNQKLTLALLEKWGHAVVVAADGQAALDALECGAFDLVLMDVQMPHMDGLRATALIRERETARGARRIPIVAMTARTMSGDRQRCLDAGMDEYLAKPLDIASLFAVVGAIADRSSAAPSDQSPARALTIAAATAEDRSARHDTGRVVLDHEGLLATVAGDHQLLRELVELFNVEGRRLLSVITHACKQGNAEDIASSAHALKGMVGSLRGLSSFDAALALEIIGRGGNLGEANVAVVLLEREVARLEQELNALARSGLAA